MYPYHMNQVPYAPMHYPAIPPHMKPEPVRSAGTYEPWQWDGSYGHPYLGQCHGCCNHSYFPGNFAMRPPCPHVLPPPSHGYPPVPGTYPVQYVPPSPHYMMELPRYEYNNMPRDHHCCGCLNHKCNQKEGRNVKIVEEEPDPVETSRSGESVVPYEFKNYPYPIVWLPPGYTKGKEQKGDSDQKGCDRRFLPGGEVREDSKASEEQPNAWNGGWFPFNVNNLRLLDSDHKEKEKSSPRGGNSKSSEKQQDPWNGEWFPFDVQNLRSLKEGEDHNKSQHSQDEKQNGFPFPLFWMPYKPEATENEEPKENVPKNLVSAPVKPDKVEAKQEEKINDNSRKLSDRKVVVKTIPVKQVEQNEEKKTAEDTMAKNEDKKSVDDNANKRSSSPRKSSKLPPVCLRIDPLPKKKGRCPSPPGDKGRSRDESGKTSEPTVSSTVKENPKPNASATKDGKDSTRNEEVEQNKSKVKSIEVSEGKTVQDGGAMLKSAGGVGSDAEKSMTQMPESSKEVHGDQAGNDVKKETTEVKPSSARDLTEPKENLPNDVEKFRRIKLSDEEAATVIQSAFRGFEVRKWEPLEKLKQLAEVRKQMGEIKNRIQALESSTDTSSNDKQRICKTEMIMSLLLKLDTIQGVHPSIREIRKSLAKELVSLQETLDLLISKNLKECVEQPSRSSSEETISKEIKENLGTDGKSREDNIGPKRETESTLPESHQNQTFSAEDMNSHSEDVEISESMMINGNLDGDGDRDRDIENLSGNSLETGSEQAKEVVIEDNDKKIGDSLVREAPQVHGRELEQTVQSQQLGVETTSSTAEMVDSNSTCEAKVAEKSAEKPKGVSDGNLDTEISIEHEKSEPRNGGELIEEISITPENDEVEDLNRVAHEEVQKEQVISNVEDDLGGEEQQKTDSEVLGEVSPSEFLEEDTKVAPIKATEDSVAEVLSEVLPSKFLEEETEFAPIKATEGSEAEILGEVSPSEFLEEETGVAPTKATEGSEVTVPDLNIGNGEGSPAIVPEFLGEVSRVSEEMKDETHENGVANMNSLSGSEVTEAVPTAHEPAVELSKEDSMEVKKNIIEEGLDDHHREDSVAVNSMLVEGGDNETGGTKMAVQSVADEELSQIESTDKNSTHHEEVDISPPSPTASEISRASMTTESDRKLMEENEKLREMMEKLLEAGNKQLNTISSLSRRVKDLEKKLSRKRKLKIRRSRIPASGSSCLKSWNYSPEERAVRLAM